MSRFFGPIVQTAYVVKTIEPLLNHFINTLGVGPFFMLPMPVTLDWAEYRGVRVDQNDLFAAVALAYSGDTMIEIIVPGTSPSHYHEFLQRGGSGVHHLGTVVADYDARMEAARSAGHTVLWEGCAGSSRFAYIETDLEFPGTMIELLDPSVEMAEMFDMIKAASVGWDGREAIRHL